MKALLVIDVQNDFLPNGALPVSHGDEVLPIIRKILPKFKHVIATQDWHPLNHVSFASTHHKRPGEIIRVGNHSQILWPDHCVQNTHGAALSEAIDPELIEKIIYKGTEVEIDSYSAFFDNAKSRSTGLDEYLKQKKINELYFCGLATDYCVLFSVLDALDLGYECYIIVDGCRGMKKNVHALSQMEKKGAHLTRSSLF